jgi:hypothetical protein
MSLYAINSNTRLNETSPILINTSSLSPPGDISLCTEYKIKLKVLFGVKRYNKNAMLKTKAIINDKLFLVIKYTQYEKMQKPLSFPFTTSHPS